MKHSILCAFFVLLISLAAPQVYAVKLYKWVDSKGNISYQDQPPPEGGTILKEEEVQSSSNAEPEDNLPPEIVVYSVDDCELCERLRGVLRQNKVPYIERSLVEDPDAQRRILERASSVIVPTIFIGEKIVQGGTEDRLREELRSAGFEIKEKVRPKPTNRLLIEQ